MMETHAFDAIAGSYDQAFTHSEIGRMQREKVYEHLSKILAGLNGHSILELGCGTGEDALWLARKNFSVKALDISAGMIRECRRKAEQSGLPGGLVFHRQSMTNIGTFPVDEKYHLIFSNFGGFNCISPQEVEGLSGTLADHLYPGGHFVAVVMGNFCLWESLYYLAKFSFRKAFRRLSQNGRIASIGHGTGQRTWYYSPSGFYRRFSSGFVERARYPIGFFIPPSYLSDMGPVLLRNLNRLEKTIQGISSASLASDHYLIHLQKKE